MPPGNPAGNGVRFAAVPLAAGGTPVQDWLVADRLPTLDLTACRALVLVAPHPDDETLGMGATAAQLAASGVDVQVVSASDGGAAYPGAPASERHRLEVVRRAELRRATEILGVRSVVSLGLPDGRLTEHEDRLAEALVTILDGAVPGTWCVATWRGDGHPDHEAVGRAAAKACALTEAELMEYPVWMWHWASPTDPAVPWDRAYSVRLSRSALDRKYQAAQCFQSQISGPDAARLDAAPVLPPFVLRRLMAVGEVVFR